MIVNLEELTKAVQKVRSFADTIQQVPGVMLDMTPGRMSVCYSDGKKSIIEKVLTVSQEEDVQGKLVVAYNRLMSIIDMCQPSGGIITGELTISFSESGTDKIMTLEATKYMGIQKKTEDFDEDGNPVYVDDSKPVSKFSQQLKYNYPEENQRYGVLSRMNYEDIFKDADGNTEGTEGFDVWETEDLKKMLTRTSSEKGKIIYISGKEKAVFVSNLAYVAYIPNDSCSQHGMVVSTTVAKALSEILGKITDKEVRVCVKDSRYANIINGTDSVGIWFEMSPASKNDINTVKYYQAKDYNSFELAFSKAALLNVINCAMDSTKDEKTTLQFDIVDGKKSLKIVSVNTGASISGDFNVMLEREDEITNWEELKEIKLPMSLKVIKDMISDCETTYIGFDIQAEEAGGKMVRIAEVFRDENEQRVLGATYYTVAVK